MSISRRIAALAFLIAGCGGEAPSGDPATAPFMQFLDRWTKPIVTYRWVNGHSRLTDSQLDTIARDAFATWRTQWSSVFGVGLQFDRTTGTPDISLRFGRIDGVKLGKRAQTEGLAGTPVVITLDEVEDWAIGSPEVDPQGILTHEIGHALGFGHSSVSGSTMFWRQEGSTVGNRSLSRDDCVVANTKYGKFRPLGPNPGARDIAVSANQVVWVVGSQPVPGGFRVLRWSGDQPCCGSWQASDGGAVRIAVDLIGRPWLTNSLNQIWRRTSNGLTTGVWEQLPGAALDIGVGVNGHVWVVGTDNAAYAWNGSAWTREASGTPISRITVDENGAPWATSAGGRVMKFSSSDPRNGTWETLPAAPVAVTDLGIAFQNYLWVIGRTASGNLSTSVWASQPAVAGQTRDPREWHGGLQPAAFGAVSAVSVGIFGLPYLVAGNGAVLTAYR
jgi:hypothetical protein